MAATPTLTATGDVAPRKDLHAGALFHSISLQSASGRIEDSGHWESTEISASSIGTVVAGLEALLLVHEPPDAFRGSRLIDPGDSDADLARAWPTGARRDPAVTNALSSKPGQNRRYDAALLFLLFPLDVIKKEPRRVRCSTA